MPLFGLTFSGYGLLNRVVFKVLSLKRDIQFYYSELLNTASFWIRSLKKGVKFGNGRSTFVVPTFFSK